MPFGLHPKVAWPLLVNAILTVLATIATAYVKGDQAAFLAAIIGGGTTIVGLVTGYAVSSPAPPVTVLNATAGAVTGTITTTPTSGGGSITTVP